jgi:hypothetical protein
MNQDWIKDIPDYEKCFTRDQREAIKALQDFLGDKLLGFEAYMALHKHFEKTSIHFSSQPITFLKKAWAIKNKNVAYDEAARILGVSVKTIYNWREEKGITTDNLELFKDTK